MAPTGTGRRKSRRPFGGIRKLPSGHYQATYWRDGLQHAQTFPRKADATTWLATVEADIARGKWSDLRAGSITLGKYAEEWLTSGANRGRVRPTTEAKYRGLLDRHILPTFGDHALSKIRPVMVRKWFDDLAARHIATAAGAYRLLATIFNSAIRDELILRSPCKVEGGGSERAAERPIITMAELQTAIDATPENYRCALLLGSWGALRRGEVLALRRCAVDVEGGSVSVEAAWLISEDGHLALGEPKTQAGKRPVYLPSEVRKALKSHLSAHVGPEPDAWLFPGANGGPMHPRTFARVWKRARDAAARSDLRFHDLRHSGLTWAAQAGGTTAELMRRAGHASPAAAIRYQHAADERDKALADALGKMTDTPG